MKSNKVIIVFLSLISWIGFAQEQKMTNSEIVAFKQKVNAVAKKIQTLSSDFTQYKHMDFLSKDIETSGKMYFSAPNLLKWQYKNPYNYSILFKNNKIFIDDEGKKNTVDIGNSKIFGKINTLIVGSVSGNMFDEKEFTISFFKTKTNNITRLLPKDASLKKYIKQIELTFDSDDATVIQVKLIESSDDYTRIVLNNKKLNGKIEDSVFNN
ncbi:MULTISPECIES: LolA family protein [Flavobacterium]|jgi:outer membrane lipoprotein-sorting protein|uniref:Outer membrane lipoprotein carrier protein LolA n=1 Tax=Flavobacterium jumunjinense TaxID=998845 RepID=A0ABV5GKM1_9FLAO|nr:MULTISPECIES: outer membrane lipoprotein carrier protein LolA [Flavobacterium]